MTKEQVLTKMRDNNEELFVKLPDGSIAIAWWSKAAGQLHLVEQELVVSNHDSGWAIEITADYHDMWADTNQALPQTDTEMIAKMTQISAIDNWQIIEMSETNVPTNI